MLRMKEEEWEVEVYNFLFSELDSERDESFDSVKLCESIPFNPGIIELKSSDSSPLEKLYLPIEFLLPSIEPTELIHLISPDFEPDMSHQILEVFRIKLEDFEARRDWLPTSLVFKKFLALIRTEFEENSRDKSLRSLS
ncbi:hypothetical protein LguiA_000579 [Lonicera macranthoides]